MFIQTGYGAEGALPDATAFDITERNIKPQFRSGNYDRGLTIGVNLICQALKGEYKGTGRTVREGRNRQDPMPVIIFIIFVIIFILRIFWAARRGYRYSGLGGPFIGGGGGGSGGGWSSGGGGFSGGFSGGGEALAEAARVPAGDRCAQNNFLTSSNTTES